MILHSFVLLAFQILGDSHNNVNVEFLVLDRNGRVRPYAVKDIHGFSPNPVPETSYLARFQGLRGRRLPQMPYRAILAPLDVRSSDAVRGVPCFDTEVKVEFIPGGAGDELVVVKSGLRCPSTIDYDWTYRPQWTIRNAPPGRLRVRVAHATSRSAFGVYDAWVQDGRFKLRPDILGPYVLTLFDREVILGHITANVTPSSLAPNYGIELDWRTRKQIR